MKRSILNYLSSKNAAYFFIAIFILFLIFKKFDLAIGWFIFGVIVQLVIPYLKAYKIKRESKPDLEWLEKQDKNKNILLINKKTNTEIGTMTAGQILFLANQFVKNSMESNGFYFNKITLELFKKQYKNEVEITNKIDKILNNQDEIEIFWKDNQYIKS
jgi:Co/Zn/Cd efflux system component